MKSKGLGDSVEKFFQKTGIKSVVKAGAKLAGVKDCGCKKRKEALNRAVPYDSKSLKNY
jgi:hypothetical protein